ncbi:hypothetical protein ACMFMF_005942 [Clarireedia jacksonii]
MSTSSLHMINFALSNSAAFSLDPDGPIPFVYRLIAAKRLSASDLDLIPFHNKKILVVGSSSGCGLECARILAQAGCHLIITARSERRREEVSEELRSRAHHDTKVQVMMLDTTSFDSLRSFGAEVQKLSHLDIVILNAGVYRTDYTVCPETGWEETLQVNFISTYILSLLLLPLLLKSPMQGRLLLVSSEAHAWADIKNPRLDDLLHTLNNRGQYNCYDRYHASKLLIVLWAQELSRRLDPQKVLVASVSPGYCHTGLFRDFNTKTISCWMERIFCRSAHNGACEYLTALANLDVTNKGRFFANSTNYPPCRAARSEIAGKIRSSIYHDMAVILPASISALLSLV